VNVVLVLLSLISITCSGIVLALIIFRKNNPVAINSDLSTSLQNLTQSIQDTKFQTAVLTEKVTHIEPITNSITAIQLGLIELQAQTKARHEMENKISESIRRVESIIAGTQSKGVAGENILETIFARLPPEWQVRNLRVGNKVVEFGLRMPNGLILPIDSKWPATALLEQFLVSTEPEQQMKIKRQIEDAVISKAKEVKKYIDPGQTMGFGLAIVPDAVYELSNGVQADVFQLNVVLLSYSMFLPYLLLVFQTVLKTSQNIDLEKLDAYLQVAQESMNYLQKELDGRFSTALTMLNNSRNDIKTNLSKINSGLVSLQLNTKAQNALPETTSATDNEAAKTD